MASDAPPSESDTGSRDWEDSDMIESILKDETGYSIYRETTGEDVLKCMRQQQIDIVLLDMKLKDMECRRRCWRCCMA